MRGLDAQSIHSVLGVQGWRNVLLGIGLTEQQLRKKNIPCPICGGKDRFTCDNRTGHGDYYCRQCGAGDGFRLVMGVSRVEFSEARRIVMSIAGLSDEDAPTVPIQRAPESPPPPASPTCRVRDLLREACQIEDCEPARRYLQSRGLWPLPAGHKLRAHPSVDYWQEGERVGHHAALLASVRDIGGQVVTAHVTYLEVHGAKITHHDPRKILSPMTGRAGCAVRLMNVDADTLGIAEGIETALSAAALHGVPVWAALNTALLGKFEPPPEVKRLVIFADRDIAGMDAAAKLMQRLQGRVQFEVSMPHCKDWNDALLERT